MTHRNFIFLLIILSLFLSCQNRKDVVKVYTDEGVLYQSYPIDKDSLIQGQLYTYYEDGEAIFEKATYIDNKLSGQRILYFENGQAEIIEQYIDNVLTDTLKVFYASGQIKKLEYYKNGTLTGPVLLYFENGQIRESVNFANNVENGPFSEYYSNGQIKWKGQYLDGNNEFGELLQYDSTGVLIRKLMCDSMAICRTFWTLEDDALTQ